VRAMHVVTRHARGLDWLKRSGDSLALLRSAREWWVVGEKAPDLGGMSFLQCPPVKNPDRAARLNLYLDQVPDRGQWVYVLDDDNLIHPCLEAIMDRVHPDCQLVVVSQQLSPTSVRVANPWGLTVQWVDSAQYCVTRALIDDLRHWEIYRHDGYFLMELVIRARESGARVQVFQEVGSFYNAQHWL
jgi:hypothetical protein